MNALLLETFLVHLLYQDIDVVAHALQVLPQQLVLCLQELLLFWLGRN